MKFSIAIHDKQRESDCGECPFMHDADSESISPDWCSLFRANLFDLGTNDLTLRTRHARLNECLERSDGKLIVVEVGDVRWPKDA